MLHPSPHYSLQTSLGFQTTLTARILARGLEDGLRPHGLTRIGWCVLLAVAEEGIATPSDIADFLHIDRTATSRALRQLEGRSLIARNGAKGDRRQTNVSITAAGQNLLAKTVPIGTANMAAFTANLDSGEQADLLRLLTKLRQSTASPPR